MKRSFVLGLGRWVAVAVLGTVGLAPAAYAAESMEEIHGEIGIIGGLHRGDRDLGGGHVTHSPVFGLRWASRLSRPLNWFVDATHTEFEALGNTENSKLNEVRGGLERLFPNREDNFEWFIAGAGGFGDVNHPPTLGDFGRPLLSLGAGLRQRGSGSLIWRGEVRAEQLLGTNGAGGEGVTNFQFLVGVSFGLKPAKKEIFEKGATTLVLEGVNFELDSAELTRDSYTVLNRMAARLKDWPKVRVEVQGHTDSIASPEYNLELSQRRAETVRSYLISRGISASRLEARGYGESRPVADNRSEWGRAKNRRVVLRRLD